MTTENNAPITKTTTAKKDATTVAKKAGKKRALSKPLNKVGKFFSTLRIHEELTSEKWAELLGVSTQLISSIERGDNKLTIDKALVLSRGISKFPQYKKDFIKLVADETGVVLLTLVDELVAEQIVRLATGQIALQLATGEAVNASTGTDNS